MKKINVLVVEDSPVVQEFLAYILTSDPDIHVAGIANNGDEAVRFVGHERPDVITMDIHMPGMDGYEATRRIMATHPTPIVIVSGSMAASEVSFAFRAIEAGAQAVVPRPPGPGHEDFETASGELVRTVKLMSEVRVVKRYPAAQIPIVPDPRPVPRAPKSNAIIRVAAIGASTGGPVALLQILSLLPKDLSYPILIVQHISRGFTVGFAEWLGGASCFPVRVAVHGEKLEPGQAYVAPDGFHMGVSDSHRVLLSDHAPENSMRPSVAYLFRTVTRVYGPHAAGVLLTGMGGDGAEEMKTMRDAGAITMAQDEESSAVYGMPGTAVRLGAAASVLSPEGIAAMLADLNCT